jgi:predicted nucleic acid-binding protein
MDASVFLNAFNPIEEGHEISEAMLIRLQNKGVPLIAPTLLLPETAAAIRRGLDNPQLARQFALALSRLPHLTLVTLDPLLAQQALEEAALHRLRGGDAVYAAVAQRFACPLVTLDREQHDRVAAALRTFYPAAHDRVGLPAVIILTDPRARKAVCSSEWPIKAPG